MTIVGYNDSIRFDYNGDGKYTNDVDQNEDGIIDPTKVVTFALRNSVSAAAMILTTEAVVTDIPEERVVWMPLLWLEVWEAWVVECQ